MFRSEIPTLLIVFATSLGLSLVLTPLFRILARRLALIDAPDGYRKHQDQPIPLAGGLSICFASSLTFLLAILLSSPTAQALLEDPRLAALAVMVLLIGLLGLIDDKLGLRGRHKLIGQILAISVFLSLGEIQINRVQLLGVSVELGGTGVFFAGLWLLACINAMNLIDGMDGLLGSIGTIVCLTIAAIAGLDGQWSLALLAIIFAGSLIGFLYFNLPPATIYLGDCGSMVIGSVVGALSLLSSTKATTAMTLAIPVALLILPFFDTFAAIARRQLTGRSIYTTDRGHLHHCLQRRMSRPSILFLVLAFSLMTSIGAIAATIWRNDFYALLAAAVVIVSLVVSRLFGHVELHLIKDRLLATLATFRHGPAEGADRQMTVQLQGNANWNRIWDQLIGQAEGMNLRTVCLDVNAPAMHENYHARWDRFSKSNEEQATWRIEIPLFLQDQVIGRLTAIGLRDHQPIWNRLETLIQMVEQTEEGASLVTAHHRQIGQPRPMVRPATEAERVSEMEMIGLPAGV